MIKLGVTFRISLQFGAELGGPGQQGTRWRIKEHPRAQRVHEPEQVPPLASQSTPHILAFASAMNAAISSGESGVSGLVGSPLERP